MALDIKCPMCGLERPDGDHTYECVECGGEGFDCCVPGNHALCNECAGLNED